jgi:GTP cyclohydrolase IA
MAPKPSNPQVTPHSLTWDDVVAGLMNARGFYITQSPEKATAFIDDIIDSGATMDKYRKRFPGKVFYGLVGASGGWVVFPWEGEADVDAEDIVRRQLQFIGEDPSREGLKDTPARVVRSWKELFGGYALNPAEILAREFESGDYDQMILCKNVDFFSTCEHHILPFSGVAHVAYVPAETVVGLSKMARLVDCFARRLQIQERMTEQIADAMDENLNPRGIAVVVEAQHFCMACRGAKKQNARMVTSSLRGSFRSEASARAEFFSLINQ